ncbi:glycosyltransferase family 2 protein [Ideonella dechloratans]|uniref:glycosyltransferase family 2 protein n=1 Tax=Ideonella dechloratans TaxID=36863 RepID=UPI0035B4BF70
MELTILMPCLNEAATLERCICKAQSFLARAKVEGEVLISDNGSTDGSQDIAQQLGARVVHANERGYGAALRQGIGEAQGRYVILGDADDSYDFSRLDLFLRDLRAGAQLVMGNRFAGGIAPGAMPFLHKWLGNPVLSFLGRLFFRTPVRDFHCGLRGGERAALLGLRLTSPGMEFASEMVVKASLAGLRITEVPTTLDKDGRGRPPHLRTWRDGWRHLRYLLVMSPAWLFLLPGSMLFLAGVTGMSFLAMGPVHLGHIGLGVHTMLYAAESAILGWQLLLFYPLLHGAGMALGILPPSTGRKLVNAFSLERGLLIAGAMFLGGLILTLYALRAWTSENLGALDPNEVMRITIPSTALMLAGAELCFASFVLHFLQDLGAKQQQYLSPEHE